MAVLALTTLESWVFTREVVGVAFGKVLRELRHEKGLSQEELAADAELDRTYPSLLERGLRTPTLTVLFEIANALDTSPQLLVIRTAMEIDRMLN
jgi:transcriptional regulator with XRE-family HTH domain